MRVFRIIARHLERPHRRRTAHVVAENPDEAVLLLKKSIHFWDYAMPPEKIADLGDSEAEIGRVRGAASHTEKGVFPVAPAEPEV